MINNKTEFYRTYANCKRGMLELDIVLLNFLELEYSKLNTEDLKILNKLLLESDQDLYYWLIKDESCDKLEFTHIISHIKTTIKLTKFI